MSELGQESDLRKITSIGDQSRLPLVRPRFEPGRLRNLSMGEHASHLTSLPDLTLIARFMGPILAPWTSLSGWTQPLLWWYTHLKCWAYSNTQFVLIRPLLCLMSIHFIYNWITRMNCNYGNECVMRKYVYSFVNLYNWGGLINKIIYSTTHEFKN